LEFHSFEVLEDERRMVGGESINDGASYVMESGTHPIPLPPSLPLEKNTPHSSVVTLLSLEILPSTHVAGLNLSDIWELDPHEVGPPRVDSNAVG
jgi:hypothetical protein